MRKKLIVFLIVMMVVINLIVGALLFLDIQLMEAPEITVNVDVIEINSEEAIMQMSIDVANPNSFGLITKDFEVVAATPSGDEIAHVLIEGGDIPPYENKTFTVAVIIAFDGYGTGVIKSKITGKMGVSVGFIQKTIPLAINIVTSLEDVIKAMASPDIYIEADFGRITREGINATVVINAYNPNTFDIYIENISVEIENETGGTVGNLDIVGGTIAAKGSLKLVGSGMILIEALNAKMLSFNVSARAGAKIAGINKSMSFYTDARIKIPDLEMLLSKDKSTGVALKADIKVTTYGLVSGITLEVKNPNKIELIVKDIVCSIYGIYNDVKRLIGESEIEGGLVSSENTTFFTGEVIIPYSNLVPTSLENGLLPDWALFTVITNVTINGLDQSFPIELSGYQDLHPFR